MATQNHGNLNGETSTIEYKTSFVFSNDPQNPDKDQKYVVFRAICAFLNTEGGALYLGVSDDGKVVGLRNDIRKIQNPDVHNLDSYSRYIYDQAYKYIKNFEFVKDLVEVDPVPNKGYITIRVSSCNDCVVHMKDNSAFRRTGTRTELMNKMMISRREKDLQAKKSAIRKINKYGRFCNAFIQAKNEKKKVRIIRYQSGNSDTIRDRIVEPINFLSDSECIWCYEAASENCHLKQFKLSRMADVEIMDEAWEHETEHKTGATDVFGWTGHEEFEILMTLNVTAHNMIIEQYPKTNNDTYMTDCGNGTWLFHAYVHNLDPVIRFCTGWLDQIQIWSEDLKSGIRNFIQTAINPSLEQQYSMA